MVYSGLYTCSLGNYFKLFFLQTPFYLTHHTHQEIGIAFSLFPLYPGFHILFWNYKQVLRLPTCPAHQVLEQMLMLVALFCCRNDDVPKCQQLESAQICRTKYFCKDSSLFKSYPQHFISYIYPTVIFQEKYKS